MIFMHAHPIFMFKLCVYITILIVGIFQAELKIYFQIGNLDF